GTVAPRWHRTHWAFPLRKSLLMVFTIVAIFRAVSFFGFMSDAKSPDTWQKPQFVPRASAQFVISCRISVSDMPVSTLMFSKEVCGSSRERAGATKIAASTTILKTDIKTVFIELQLPQSPRDRYAGV